MEIKVFVTILLSTILINNYVLSRVLGICPFLGVSKKLDSAVGMGLAVIFVMTMTSCITYPVYKFILIPFRIEFLLTIVFILVIAALVQLVEMVIEKYAPALYTSLGIFLPLIAVNCAILGGSLFMQEREYANITEATVFGLGSGVGWFLAIVG
ncbi:MAG: hypothetical protein E4G96_11180, partial [Chrysiogenales bacterium]